MSIALLPCGCTARRPGPATGLADDGRASQGHFGRDARLGGGGSTGSCPGGVAARTGGSPQHLRPAHGLGGLAGATPAAGPAVALAGSHELPMMIIRSPPHLLSNQRSPRKTHDTPVGRWRGARRRRVLFQRPPVRTPRASFPARGSPAITPWRSRQKYRRTTFTEDIQHSSGVPHYAYLPAV